MTAATQTMDGLVASRICHDLISPIGALGNGLELAAMSATIERESEEMTLITDCAAAALHTLTYLRIAFGAAGDRHLIGWRELADTVTPYMTARKFTVNWPETEGGLPRIEAKARLLLLLCLQDAAPAGGVVTAMKSPGWRAPGGTVGAGEAAARFGALLRPEDCAPGDVHYLALRQAAQAMGREVSFRDDGRTAEFALV